jgi:thiamine-phosphate pyrophosphorylase
MTSQAALDRERARVRLLSDPSGLCYRLIAITDDARDGRDGLVARAAAAVRGGATMVQLRLKHTDARTLVDIAQALVAALPVPVVVNDRADVAIASGAAGVHVGTDDIPVAALRRVVPPGFLIGASVGSESEAAQAAGADYAGIGPLHGSASKLDAGMAIGLDGFSRLATQAGLPAIAIGGMTIDTAGRAIQAGAVGIAVIAGIFAGSDPEGAARALREAIDRAWLAARPGAAAAGRPAGPTTGSGLATES